MTVSEVMPIIALITVIWIIAFGFYVDWFEKHDSTDDFPNDDWDDF